MISGSQGNALRYELCSFPDALFESKSMLLEADEPNLANAIWSAVPSMANPDLNDSLKYVLDGVPLFSAFLGRWGTHMTKCCRVTSTM